MVDDLSKAVILDTETTGLGKSAVMVELGIIDAQSGEVLLSSLLRPLQPIDPEATAQHHISAQDVALAPTWPEVVGDFIKAVKGKKILIYNANYDTRVITTTNEMHIASGDSDLLQLQLMERVPALLRNVRCVMLYYNELKARQSGRREKWCKLTVAAEEQGVKWGDLQAHRAVADCEITRRLLHALKARALT